PSNWNIKLKPLTITFAILLIASVPHSAVAQTNIIQIIADDMGWVDLSVNATNFGNGSPFYQTPNLEAMSAGGMSFSSAYVLPTCVPTRGAIFTGQYAPRTQLYTVGGLNSNFPDPLLQPPPSSSNIPNGALTIAELLQSAGYVTAHIGKFHATGNPNQIVSQHGFSINIGGTTSGSPSGVVPYFAEEVQPGVWEFGTSHGPELDPYASPYTQSYIVGNLLPFANNNDPMSLVNTPKHLNDAMADATIDFLTDRTCDGNSFFVNVAFNAVHGEVNSRADLEDKYLGIPPSTNPNHNATDFAGLLEGMDQAIGRIMSFVQNSNLATNTIIVFIADNGPAGNISDTFPLSGNKGTFQEGGIRVPMIVYGPGFVPAGSSTDEIVHAIDLYKTYAQLASAPLPDESVHAIDGESLVDLISNPASELNRDTIYYHFPGYGQNTNTPSTYAIHDAIDGNRYKLRYLFEDRSFALFDITNDIAEANDLMQNGMNASQFGIANFLSQKIRDWLNDIEADLPTVTTTENVTPNVGHSPPIRFDLRDTGLGQQLQGLQSGSVSQVGVTLTVEAIGSDALIDAANAGIGVTSSLDSGGPGMRRRINGTLDTPEKLHLSFDRDVVLKFVGVEQLDNDNIESVVFESVVGENPFSSLFGYDSGGFALANDGLTFKRSSGNQNQPIELRLGTLDHDEIEILAGSTISITTDPATDGGVVLLSLGVAIKDFVLGDLNLDGAVNLLDIAPFVQRIVDGQFQLEGDFNLDGQINLLDISHFVERLSAG
ncbi:MAG: sulfatase-like hydrolase/transferase, partial [Planctomycetota bacterium]